MSTKCHAVRIVLGAPTQPHTHTGLGLTCSSQAMLARRHSSPASWHKTGGNPSGRNSSWMTVSVYRLPSLTPAVH